jgi:hypothetical protein
MARARDIANIINSGTFLTPASASATYLSQISASNTYTTKSENGLVLLNSSTITNGSTNHEINNVFTSTYQNYLITYLITQSSGVESRFRYLDSSGEVSSANYFSQYTRSNTTTVSTARQTGITYGVLIDNPNTTYTGTINVFLPNTNYETYAFLNGLDTNNVSGTNITTIRFAAGNFMTGIKFFLGSGNFTGGFIKIYGYKN